MTDGRQVPEHDDRGTSLTFRLAIAERERLKHQAGEQGLTLQQLFEQLMLGGAKPRRAMGRRPKPAQSEELHFDKSA